MNFDYLLKDTNLKPINETLESLFSYINKYKSLKKMRVLEIGIGNGNYSIPMSKNFKSYYGIEPIPEIYEVFIESCKKHNCNIKSYNMDFEQFINNNNKKFDLIILRNVIHLIDYDDLIKLSAKIVKKNAFIIIQNKQALPVSWGNKQFVKDSSYFNETKWLVFKNHLEKCYNNLLDSKYLDKFEKNEKDYFFILKSDNYFTKIVCI